MNCYPGAHTDVALGWRGRRDHASPNSLCASPTLLASFQKNTECPSGGLPALTQLSSVAQVFSQPPPKTLVLDPVPAGPESLQSEQKGLARLALGHTQEGLQGRAGWRFQRISEWDIHPPQSQAISSFIQTGSIWAPHLHCHSTWKQHSLLI